jgi:hypothetical protein
MGKSSRRKRERRSAKSLTESSHVEQAQSTVDKSRPATQASCASKNILWLTVKDDGRIGSSGTRPLAVQLARSA